MLLACAWALLAASVAQASTVTVGSVLPLTFTSEPFGQVGTLLNTSLPERGANLVSPVNGAIVRWQMQGAKGGPFSLRVLHPTGNGAYTAVGTSGPATVSGTGLQTFTTNVPVHVGDLIGVDPANASDEIGFAAVPGAGTALIFPAPFEGSTRAPNETGSGKEIELSAEVLPAPEVSSVSPRSGSIAGGTTVTVTGKNLTAANAVRFGTTATTSFTVDSDTQITATVPATTRPGSVDVVAVTLAGPSVTARGDRFTYTACVVPRLKGKKLKPVTKALRNAGCALGRVGGNRTRKARVRNQAPKPGKVLGRGARVNVRLGA